MTYESVATVSQVAALLIFFGFFVGVIVYVFWPGNKKRFEQASKLPLEDGAEDNDEKRDG
jgi:cytochrome c oxidase cbb3-type subunit IV